MSGRNVRRLLLLAVLGGIGWWVHEKHPTVSGLVDDLTRPLMGSRAVVSESEQKRVVSEASQVVSHGEEKPVAALREGMTDREVRALLGDPDEILPDGDSGLRLRWVYRTVDRVLVFDRHRLVSIAIR
jgi:hypothetical protein